MDETTCPECGYFGDDFEKIETFDYSAESGAEYSKYICPHCGAEFVLKD